jgi:phosphopantetheinyl transferase
VSLTDGDLTLFFIPSNCQAKDERERKKKKKKKKRMLQASKLRGRFVCQRTQGWVPDPGALESPEGVG